MIVFTHMQKDFTDRIVSDVIYTIHDEGDIHNIMQEFRRFLLAISFQPETVNKYIEAE